MPKDDERKEMTQEEIDAREEKFRTFFTYPPRRCGKEQGGVRL